MYICGPPGVGKSTVIWIVSNKLKEQGFKIFKYNGMINSNLNDIVNEVIFQTENKVWYKEIM